jgi:hypothetical protein
MWVLVFEALALFAVSFALTAFLLREKKPAPIGPGDGASKKASMAPPFRSAEIPAVRNLSGIRRGARVARE